MNNRDILSLMISGGKYDPIQGSAYRQHPDGDVWVVMQLDPPVRWKFDYLTEDVLRRFIHLDLSRGRVDFYECPDEDRERVLRECPCLLRQGKTLVPVNPEREGLIYIIDDLSRVNWLR